MLYISCLKQWLAHVKHLLGDLSLRKDHKRQIRVQFIAPTKMSMCTMLQYFSIRMGGYQMGHYTVLFFENLTFQTIQYVILNVISYTLNVRWKFLLLFRNFTRHFAATSINAHARDICDTLTCRLIHCFCMKT